MRLITIVRKPFKRLFFVSILIMILFQSCQEKEFGPADFEGEPRSGKAPLEVKFTYKSNVFTVEWDWKFPGGSPSEAEGKGPHTVKYDTQGEYDVSLKILYYVEQDSIPRSDTETKVKYITVTAQ